MDASQASHQAFSEPLTIELAEAAAQGNAAQVDDLVARGADPNAQGDKGVSVLQFALLAQNADGMRALLRHRADPNAPGLGGSTAVHLAAMADDPQYLDILLAAGADPNARHRDTQAVPLAAAAGPRTDAQFRMLLDAGADPNLADRTGNTPLHTAGMINAGAHVLRLLEAGANPNAKNAQDATFQTYYFKLPQEKLSEAAQRERAAVIAWLRERHIPLETAATAETKAL